MKRWRHYPAFDCGPEPATMAERRLAVYRSGLAVGRAQALVVMMRPLLLAVSLVEGTSHA